MVPIVHFMLAHLNFIMAGELLASVSAQVSSPETTDGHVFFRRPGVFYTCKSDDDDVQINITKHVPKAVFVAACGWKCDNSKCR